jgi:hypothetical protein
MTLQTQTKTVTFRQVNYVQPTRHEIKSGIYALNKVSGDWVKIPRDNICAVNPNDYSLYVPASSFPQYNGGYADKYADLVKARDILKNDRYGYNSDITIGKAIGLIKRFLDKHGKV